MSKSQHLHALLRCQHRLAASSVLPPVDCRAVSATRHGKIATRSHASCMCLALHCRGCSCLAPHSARIFCLAVRCIVMVVVRPLVIACIVHLRQAKRKLAKFLGVAAKDLEKRRSGSTAAKIRTKVKYVYHNRVTDKRYARVRGQYRGTFDTEEEAIRAAGRHSRKRKAPITRDMLDATRVLCKCFSDWVPGDIEHMIKFRKANPLFAAASGPLYLLAALGKEDFCRAHACVCIM